MFGAVVRAAATFVGGMLVASAVREPFVSTLLPRLATSLGSDSLLYTSLSGVLKWLPFIIVIALTLGLIARGIAENSAAVR
jgi:hypothetical protein